MKEEFVPYEEALALKELGFDEPCFGFYYLGGAIELFQTCRWNFRTNSYWNATISEGDNEYVVAPLYQQAFRWLIQFPQIKKSSYNIALYPDGTYSIKDGKDSIHEYLSPEDCLKKLIETVKEK